MTAPTRLRRASAATAIAIALLTDQVRAGLTAATELSAAYDAILAAQFERAAEQLNRACPPAPMEACTALGVVSDWWRILVHPESRAEDKTFLKRATDAIDRATHWTRREPERAEAWFYLAGAYAPLVQWRVLRGERIAAAREGTRIKNALERAIQLDPGLVDAQFGIGLYQYYADVAPAAAKMLRWLLLLPGGDREKGLARILEARDRGQLLTGEADYQLHLLYLWYEHQPAVALDLLEKLAARYPTNPLFLQRIAELHDVYRHDPSASAHAWRLLLERAQRRTVYAPEIAAVRAHLGLASQFALMERTDDAIEQLRIVIAQRPQAPAGALTRAETTLRALSKKSGR